MLIRIIVCTAMFSICIWCTVCAEETANESGHYSGNYVTHWNDTYLKIIVPVKQPDDKYRLTIENKKILNEAGLEIQDAPHGELKNAEYFILMTHFPNVPRPKKVLVEFDWVISRDQAAIQAGNNSAKLGRFIGNYSTHWNETYVKVVVPVHARTSGYDLKIIDRQVWNQNRDIIQDFPHEIEKTQNYFTLMTHFPNPPRPREIEIQFDWGCSTTLELRRSHQTLEPPQSNRGVLY